MDYRNIDIERLTDNERIQFQNENLVSVLGEQYGADYYDDCRPKVFGMADYIGSNPAYKTGETLKKALSEDDLIAMRRQLPLLPLAFSKGYPIVVPDYTKFKFGQEKEFIQAVKVSIAKNAEIIKKHSISMPPRTNGRTNIK